MPVALSTHGCGGHLLLLLASPRRLCIADVLPTQVGSLPTQDVRGCVHGLTQVVGSGTVPGGHAAKLLFDKTLLHNMV